MLALAAAEHGHSAELFSLITQLIKDESARLYLAARGFLPVLCQLISAEVARILAREADFRYSSSDIAQGEVLKNLLQLLASLLEVPRIRSRFKSTEGLLRNMLDNFLHVQSLIVQKTKLIDDCAHLLMSAFAFISSESDADKRRFCVACVSALETHLQGRTPVFLLQELSKIMCPVKTLPTYLLILTKSPSQEEYIRGTMTKNPYVSSDIGLVMRDVKRKICLDLDMAGLMDDENGMELLVRGNIVSLDLPIHLVYELVWRPAVLDAGSGSTSSPYPPRGNLPMEVVYRLQGLDGEATEPLVETLHDTAAVDVDPEEEAAMTALMSETNGLAILLQRVAEIDALAARGELEPLLLGLLHSCCRLRVNRRAALALGAVQVLLARISGALQQDPLPRSVEQMLLIVELLVEEGNLVDPQGGPAVEGSSGSVSAAAGASVEQVASLLLRVGSPAVRAHPKILGLLANVLPFLTYGDAALMDMLVSRFMPHLNVLLQTKQHQGKSKSSEEREEDKQPDPEASEREREAAQLQQLELVPGTDEQEIEAYVECFGAVVQRMGQEAAKNPNPQSAACRLREKLTQGGLVRRLARVLAETLPPADSDKTSPLWAEALAVPSLPRVLKLLTGITAGYLPAQTQVAEERVLASLHVLEEKSSSQQMGSLAEELLSALALSNAALTQEIEALRDATVESKRAMAQAQRERLLKEMGLHVGQDAAKAFSEQAKAMGWEEDDMADDEGIVCIICREGYKYKPEEVLGVYVLNRRCSISQSTAPAGAQQQQQQLTPPPPQYLGQYASPASSASSNTSPAAARALAAHSLAMQHSPPRAHPSSRADRCFSTVCNMSVVHMSCHAQATRAERSLKVPRLEWDGASLRNQNTRCNNLLPLRGPQTPAHMYAEYSERYWANIGQLGRHEGSRFRMMVHDLRMLLQRLAAGASFSVDSGGGSAHSNVKLLPFLVQMGYHCLGDVSTSTWRQASSALGKHLGRCMPPATAAGASSTASPAAGGGGGGGVGVDCADYYAVSTLWFPAKWRSSKSSLLLAMVAQALEASRLAVDGERWWEGDASAAALEVCRLPITLMALLARMHDILGTPASATAVRDSSGDAGAWTAEASAVQERLRNEDVHVMHLCDKLADLYADELAVTESIAELLDVGELLQVMSPPGDVDAFMQAASSAAAALRGAHGLESPSSSSMS